MDIASIGQAAADLFVNLMLATPLIGGSCCCLVPTAVIAASVYFVLRRGP